MLKLVRNSKPPYCLPKLFLCKPVWSFYLTLIHPRDQEFIGATCTKNTWRSTAPCNFFWRTLAAQRNTQYGGYFLQQEESINTVSSPHSQLRINQGLNLCLSCYSGQRGDNGTPVATRQPPILLNPNILPVTYAPHHPIPNHISCTKNTLPSIWPRVRILRLQNWASRGKSCFKYPMTKGVGIIYHPLNLLGQQCIVEFLNLLKPHTTHILILTKFLPMDPMDLSTTIPITPPKLTS